MENEIPSRESPQNMKEMYEELIRILKSYMILDEDDYKIIALWVIGTYFHKQFQSFPYLYLNACKGSGKSRLLKMLSYFANNGKMIGQPSESWVFRSADTTSFCFDEMENMGKDEQYNLRLLLNSCYKRGLFIPRMKKGEKGNMEAEEFEAYAPISIANIWGLDDVLQDRCITIILEQSNDKIVTKKVEVWEYEKKSRELKSSLNWLLKCNNQEVSSVVSVYVESDLREITTLWNTILNNITTLTTHTHTDTDTTLTTQDSNIFDKAFSTIDWNDVNIEPTEKLKEFFTFLWEVNIQGRELELWMPLLLIAEMIDREILKEILPIASSTSEQKKMDDMYENRDAIVINVVLMLIEGKNETDFFKIQVIKNEIVDMIGVEKTNRKSGETFIDVPEWVNVKFIGKALKRMNVIKEKNRVSSGIEVMFNHQKVKRKAESYRMMIEDRPKKKEEPKKEENTLKSNEFYEFDADQPIEVDSDV